jgi:hypothetical protein
MSEGMPVGEYKVMMQSDMYVAMIPSTGDLLAQAEGSNEIIDIASRLDEDPNAFGGLIWKDRAGDVYVRIGNLDAALRSNRWRQTQRGSVAIGEAEQAWNEYQRELSGEKIIKINTKGGTHIPIQEDKEYRIVVEKRYEDLIRNEHQRTANTAFNQEFMGRVHKYEKERLKKEDSEKVGRYFKEKFDLNVEVNEEVIDDIVNNGVGGVPYFKLLYDNDQLRLLQYINEFQVFIDSALYGELGHKIDEAYKSLGLQLVEARKRVSTATSDELGLEGLDKLDAFEREEELNKLRAVTRALDQGYVTSATGLVFNDQQFEHGKEDEKGYGCTPSEYLGKLAEEKSLVNLILSGVNDNRFFSTSVDKGDIEFVGEPTNYRDQYFRQTVGFNRGRHRREFNLKHYSASARVASAREIVDELSELVAKKDGLTFGEPSEDYRNPTDMQRAEILIKTLYLVVQSSQKIQDNYSAIKLKLLEPLLKEQGGVTVAGMRKEGKKSSVNLGKIHQLKEDYYVLLDQQKLAEKCIVGIDERIQKTSMAKALGLGE